ncbi:MAG TPA: mechanosensitive ion channel domain-containing protein [Mycobacteriales bacterium]
MSLRDTITFAAVCAVAVLAGWLTGLVLRLLARRRRFLCTAAARCRWPWTITLLASAALGASPVLRVHGHAGSSLRHLLVVLVIISVTWLCIRIVKVVEDALLSRLRLDVANNRKVRKLRTQVTVLRRVIVAALIVLGLAAVLMTFAKMRALGTSLLASAGVAGIIGGLAAQSVLGNVFAGLQLAFNDALRVDDVLVVQDEWGRVEELTLTYVVLHLWDERRLVLPTTYFTTKPFQNWTRSSARNLGSVYLYLDYSAPIETLRAEAGKIVAESEYWDRQAWVLQVTDATEQTLQVRVLASASDSGRAFNLRCEIREKLIAFVNESCPDALPRTRISTPHHVTPVVELDRMLADTASR